MNIGRCRRSSSARRTSARPITRPGRAVEETTMSACGRCAAQRLEPDHRGRQALGDPLGAARAAVRDDHAADLLRVQVARRELDHLAGADQERRVPLEAREHAPRELDAGGGDRDRARADRGFRAHALGDGEGGLEQAIEQRAGRARLLRRAVGVLELAEDLRLAEDQRVEPGGDGERVAHGVRVPRCGTGSPPAPGCRRIRRRARRRAVRRLPPTQ